MPAEPSRAKRAGEANPAQLDELGADPSTVFTVGQLRELDEIGLSARAVLSLARLCTIVLRVPQELRIRPPLKAQRKGNERLASAVAELKAAMRNYPDGVRLLAHEDEVGLGIGLDALSFELGLRQQQLEELVSDPEAKRMYFQVRLVKYVANELQAEGLQATRSRNVDDSKKRFEKVCDLVFNACGMPGGSAASIKVYRKGLNPTARPRASRPAKSSAITKDAAAPVDELTRLWRAAAPLRR